LPLLCRHGLAPPISASTGPRWAASPAGEQHARARSRGASQCVACHSGQPPCTPPLPIDFGEGGADREGPALRGKLRLAAAQPLGARLRCPPGFESRRLQLRQGPGLGPQGAEPPAARPPPKPIRGHGQLLGLRRSNQPLVGVAHGHFAVMQGGGGSLEAGPGRTAASSRFRFIALEPAGVSRRPATAPQPGHSQAQAPPHAPHPPLVRPELQGQKLATLMRLPGWRGWSPGSWIKTVNLRQGRDQQRAGALSAGPAAPPASPAP